MVKLNEKGILHIPLGIAFVCLLIFSIGAWGVLRNWRQNAETQLRLDECAGKKTVELRDTLNSIESANQRIKTLRASVGLGTLLPPAAEAAQAALAVQVGLQEAQRARWMMAQVKWLSSRGCGGSGDIPGPIPSLPLTRDPPDALGPQPLRWTSQPEEFAVRIAHRPRRAAAKIVKADSDSLGGIVGETWQARWASVR
jgi:hypothetical protein